MQATKRADSTATLRFLAELGVTGWRCMSQGSQCHIATQADDGGDEEHDDEADGGLDRGEGEDQHGRNSTEDPVSRAWRPGR